MISGQGLDRLVGDAGCREEAKRVSKKLLAMLAPILGATALAMPAVAHASPHYYVNGSRLPEGERVPILEWGQLTFEEEPGTLRPNFGQTADGGFIENPVGGGAGRGQTTRFSAWSWFDEECPEGEFEVEIEGHKYEKQFEIIAPPQDLPWPSELTEKEKGKIRTNSTGVVLTGGCYAHRLTKAEQETGKATGPGENEQFPLAHPNTCETTPTMLWDPQDENGSNLGNLQSRLLFTAIRTVLSCASGTNRFNIEGSLKVMGYDASELITVQNP
jgi:hypothetical protein